MQICDLRLWACCAALVCVSLASACTDEPRGDVGADLRTLPAKPEQPAARVPINPLVSGRGVGQTSVHTGPPPPSVSAAPLRAEASVTLSGEPATLTIEQMPLPAFI